MYEDHPVLVLGITFQKEFQRPKPFRDSFGIINPVDAGPDEYVSQLQLAALAFQYHFHRNTSGRSFMIFGINADGAGADGSHEAGAHNVSTLLIHFSFNDAIDGIQKILAMVSQMKLEQIVPRHSIQQFLLPWKRPKYLPIRLGNMPELSHNEFLNAVFQNAGQ